jgi:hypothetical protein
MIADMPRPLRTGRSGANDPKPTSGCHTGVRCAFEVRTRRRNLIFVTDPLQKAYEKLDLGRLWRAPSRYVSP